MKKDTLIVGYWIDKMEERGEGAKPLFTIVDVLCEEKVEEEVKARKRDHIMRDLSGMENELGCEK